MFIVTWNLKISYSKMVSLNSLILDSLRNTVLINNNLLRYVALHSIWHLNFFILNPILINVMYGVLDLFCINCYLAIHHFLQDITKHIRSRLLVGMFRSLTIIKSGKIPRTSSRDVFNSKNLIELVGNKCFSIHL